MSPSANANVRRQFPLTRDREVGKAAALSARGSLQRDVPYPSQLLQYEILCPELHVRLHRQSAA